MKHAEGVENRRQKRDRGERRCGRRDFHRRGIMPAAHPRIFRMCGVGRGEGYTIRTIRTMCNMSVGSVGLRGILVRGCTLRTAGMIGDFTGYCGLRRGGRMHLCPRKPATGHDLHVGPRRNGEERAECHDFARPFHLASKLQKASRPGQSGITPRNRDGEVGLITHLFGFCHKLGKKLEIFVAVT